jgi:hypothetical protein
MKVVEIPIPRSQDPWSLLADKNQGFPSAFCSLHQEMAMEQQISHQLEIAAVDWPKAFCQLAALGRNDLVPTNTCHASYEDCSDPSPTAKY